MKVFYITIRHIATGTMLNCPVLARSQEEARIKATDYPYANDGYEVA